MVPNLRLEVREGFELTATNEDVTCLGPELAQDHCREPFDLTTPIAGRLVQEPFVLHFVEAVKYGPSDVDI